MRHAPLFLGVAIIQLTTNMAGKGRVEFQMALPRLDVQIRPPQVEPPAPLSAAEEARRRPDPSVRRFVWSKYEESGFPSRVNHATVTCLNANDSREYVYSIGGFHSSDQEREQRLMEDNPPEFHTGPIDIHCMDMGKERVGHKMGVVKHSQTTTLAHSFCCKNCGHTLRMHTVVRRSCLTS